MNKVLMMCYYYPPIGGIGSERPLNFSRRLPGLGWDPVVVTPRAGTLSVAGAGAGMEVPPGVRVRRTANPDLAFRLKRALGYELGTPVERQVETDGGAAAGGSGSIRKRLLGIFRNWVEMPDRTIDWYPFAYLSARKAVEEEGVRALYSKHPPYTSALVCARLSRRTGLPWVIDMVDIWTHDFNYGHTGIPAALDRRLERRTLPAARAIIVQSEGCAGILAREYPELSDRVRVIPMAFDGETFASVEPVSAGVFNVVYAGTVYHPFQDIRPFLEAVRALADRGSDLSGFAFEYMGRDGDLVRGLAERAGVSGFTRTLGQVPYAEALARQKGAGALLYLQWEPGGEVSPTGKLMQYLGAGRPILAMAETPGEADALLEKTRAGIVARGKEDAARALRSWLEEHRESGRVAFSGDDEVIASYTYGAQAERLAAILDEVAGPVVTA